MLGKTIGSRLVGRFTRREHRSLGALKRHFPPVPGADPNASVANFSHLMNKLIHHTVLSKFIERRVYIVYMSKSMEYFTLRVRSSAESEGAVTSATGTSRVNVAPDWSLASSILADLLSLTSTVAFTPSGSG